MTRTNELFGLYPLVHIETKYQISLLQKDRERKVDVWKEKVRRENWAWNILEQVQDVYILNQRKRELASDRIVRILVHHPPALITFVTICFCLQNMYALICAVFRFVHVELWTRINGETVYQWSALCYLQWVRSDVCGTYLILWSLCNIL